MTSGSRLMSKPGDNRRALVGFVGRDFDDPPRPALGDKDFVLVARAIGLNGDAAWIFQASQDLLYGHLVWIGGAQGRVRRQCDGEPDNGVAH